MRKADYALLAALIAELRHQAPAVLEALARRFAQRASVNAAEFLRACGIAD